MYRGQYPSEHYGVLSAMIRVLHVDDEPGITDVTASYLEREDERFEVKTETSASEGRDRLGDSHFDCVISDYDMPGENGIEFLEDVRREYPDLPFILYTGKGSEEVASEAIAAGATDYLQKSSGTDQYELLANRIQNAVEQYRSQQRAANLDRIRTLRSNINQALVRADSRSEAETRVCEIISDADPYLFAWIGAVDSDTGRFEPLAWAGIEENYLDEITVSADETPTGQGPGGTAFRERRVAVSQNVNEDPEFEPWRENALTRGFRAVAAVPLEHDDTLYGVLGVYSGRPYAFDEDEKELLSELGTDIAHAFQSFSIRHELRRNTRAMEKAPVGITLTDPSQDDNPLIFINEQFEEMTGYDSDEAIGRNCRFLQGEGTATEPVATMREAIDAHEQVTVELRNYRNDGTAFWNRVSIAPVETEDDEVTNFVGFQEDITKRKEREQAIEDLHGTARALLEAETVKEIAERSVDAAENILGLPSNGIYLHDGDADALEPVAWTDPVKDLMETPPTFAAGEGLAWEVFKTGKPEVYADVSTVPGRQNPDTEVRSEMILPLGDHGVFIIGSNTPDEFDDTEVSLAGTLATHVTTALDRIDHEQTLQRERKFIEQALDTVDELFYVVGTDGFLRRWNQRVVEVTGLPDEELADRQATDLFFEEDKQNIADSIEEALTTGKATVKADIQTPEGERIPYEFTGSRLTDRNGDLIGIIGIGRDISEHRERERALKQLQQRTQEMMHTDTEEETAQIAVKAAHELLGAQLSGCHLLSADQQRLEPTAYVDTVREKLGTAPTYDRTADTDPASQVVWQAFERGETLVIDDTREYGRLAEVTPSRSAIIHPLNGLGVFIVSATEINEFDDTDRTLTEILATSLLGALERVEREQTSNRQNERLEKFASVVSHDLRNPLNVASGRLELAQDDCDSVHLDDVAQAHNRMETLIEDLLMLARVGERVNETELLALPELIDSCWRTVTRTDATLVTETAQTIRGNPSRVKQLLENLFRNAVEHGGDDVTVTVGDLDDEAGFYVEDDGPGIPEDKRDDVFEAGYSTSDAGTGFGLNIVQEIVEAHGWNITITTSEAGGARFEITGVQVGAA